MVVGLAVVVVGTLLAGSQDTRTIGGVLIGSGIAMAVAGYTSMMEHVARDRDARRALELQSLHDLDETRRLLYMAFAYVTADAPTPPDIAATAANALAHHGQESGGIPWETASALIVSLTSGTYDEHSGDNILTLIQAISHTLGDDEPLPDR